MTKGKVIRRDGNRYAINWQQETEEAILLERLDGTKNIVYVGGEGNAVVSEMEFLKKTFRTKQECEKFCEFAVLLGYKSLIVKLDDASILFGTSWIRETVSIPLFKEVSDGLIFETRNYVETQIIDKDEKVRINNTWEKLYSEYKVFKEVSYIEEKVNEFGYVLTNYEEGISYLDGGKYVFVKLNTKTKNYYLVVDGGNLHRAKERKSSFVINPVSSFERQKLMENLDIIKESLDVNVWVNKLPEEEQAKREEQVAEEMPEKKADATSTEAKEEQAEASESEAKEAVPEEETPEEASEEEVPEEESLEEQKSEE